MRARTQSSGNGETPESGDSFMRLLRRIVGVPKAEIDRREAAYKEQRKPLKKRLVSVAKVIVAALLAGFR